MLIGQDLVVDGKSPKLGVLVVSPPAAQIPPTAPAEIIVDDVTRNWETVANDIET